MTQDGDVLLGQTLDDGDVLLTDGLLEFTPGLETAAYLSLFGGNEDDDSGPDGRRQWWGNLGETVAARTYRCETQRVLATAAPIPANLPRVVAAVRHDLAWMVSEGVASEVAVAASMPDLNRIRVDVAVNAAQQSIKLQYVETWMASL